MTRRSRAGLTVIELLVVIAVIGILAGLLLPAILQARSASRRSQCGGNLKQLAQAVQSFHSRMDCLPPYWGAMQGGGGEMFGGWLLHLLPDLDQQVAYDRVTPAGQFALPIPPGSSGTVPGRWVPITSTTATGRMLPARPPSADFQPARVTTGTAFSATGEPYLFPIVIPQVGDPGEPERPEVTVIVTGSSWQPPYTITNDKNTNVNENFGGLSVDHAPVTSALTLPVVLDPEDGGPTRSPSRPSATPSGYENAPLTNYQANAHVLTRFPLSRFVYLASARWTDGGNRWYDTPAIRPHPTDAVPNSSTGDAVLGLTAQNQLLQEYAGYFSPPRRYLPGGTVSGLSQPWNQVFSGSIGPEAGRRFAHIVDGLSNTFLFAEGMRQCDAERNYRHAFLPSGPGGTSTTPNWFNEHAFGILPSLRQVVTAPDHPVLISGTTRADIPTFGHTLMFQTQPRPVDCNPARMQALHGNFLMTAMCDGSVRAISSLVSRREPVGSIASGRARFGSDLGDYQSRGGMDSTVSGLRGRQDGVWDMLIVPNDPQVNVLSNTGEVGRERGPNDPPL